MLKEQHQKNKLHNVGEKTNTLLKLTNPNLTPTLTLR